MSKVTYEVIAGDCITNMQKNVKDESVPLVFADPPYNIGRDYDIYDDRKSLEQYLTWSWLWLDQATRVLHKEGSLWVAMYPNLSSELDVMCKERFGLHKRGEIVWSFGFGNYNRTGFTRSYTKLLYYTKDSKKFTFNSKDPGLRHPSMRQLKYGDKRANPDGRLPDDTWLIDLDGLKESLPEDLDLWIESRICGTFNERAKGSDNQMPQAVMERIIRASSNPGDLVVDPFMGTGSSGVAAVRLGRSFLGFELSPQYAKAAEGRIAEALKSDK